MGSYFNLGTDTTPRWINLDHSRVTSAKRTDARGRAEVHLRSSTGNDEVIWGEAADRLMAQIAADTELNKGPGG